MDPLNMAILDALTQAYGPAEANHILGSYRLAFTVAKAQMAAQPQQGEASPVQPALSTNGKASKSVVPA